MHHISSLSLKSPTIIDLASLVSGVVIYRSPSTLYILCSSSGLLLGHIQVDTESLCLLLSVFVPLPPMVLCVIIVMLPYPVHLYLFLILYI